MLTSLHGYLVQFMIFIEEGADEIVGAWKVFRVQAIRSTIFYVTQPSSVARLETARRMTSSCNDALCPGFFVKLVDTPLVFVVGVKYSIVCEVECKRRRTRACN